MQKDYRCHLIYIHAITKKKKKPLHPCFIDFAKAFDSVSPSLQWRKLFSLGLSRKILNIVHNMYSKVTAIESPPTRSYLIPSNIARE